MAKKRRENDSISKIQGGGIFRWCDVCIKRKKNILLATYQKIVILKLTSFFGHNQTDSDFKHDLLQVLLHNLTEKQCKLRLVRKENDRDISSVFKIKSEKVKFR